MRCQCVREAEVVIRALLESFRHDGDAALYKQRTVGSKRVNRPLSNCAPVALNVLKIGVNPDHSGAV